MTWKKGEDGTPGPIGVKSLCNHSAERLGRKLGSADYSSGLFRMHDIEYLSKGYKSIIVALLLFWIDSSITHCPGSTAPTLSASLHPLLYIDYLPYSLLRTSHATTCVYISRPPSPGFMIQRSQTAMLPNAGIRLGHHSLVV